MLESLLHISINAPNVKDSAELIQICLETWLHAKRRRKLIVGEGHSKPVQQMSYLVDSQVTFSANDERDSGECYEESQTAETDEEIDEEIDGKIVTYTNGKSRRNELLV